MCFLLHILWSITSGKLERISLRKTNMAVYFHKDKDLMSLPCVSACVWLVLVATEWLYQWERLFESLCGLFLMLTSRCWTGQSVFAHVCLCVFAVSFLVYMCACICMLWDTCVCPCCCAVCVLVGGSTGQLREHSCCRSAAKQYQLAGLLTSPHRVET